MQPIKRRVLDNGLVILTQEIPQTQKFVLLVGVKVGSANENSRLNGGSHFNEHMLFMSNGFRSDRQIAEDLEQNGASINAFTSHLLTLFYVKSLPEGLAGAIDIIFEAATNFNYSSEEFEKERKVILSEIQKYLDEPDGRLDDLLVSNLFKGSVFEPLIAGTVESMSGVSKKELEDFKRRFYVPNNMIVVVVGKFDENELMKKLGETFGKLESRPLVSPCYDVDLLNKQCEYRESRTDLEQMYLALGYKIPNFHKRFYTLEVLNEVLGGGFSTRLFQKLRMGLGIGYVVGSEVFNFYDNGALVVHLRGFDSRREDEAKKAIFEIFDDLKRVRLSDKELERAKNLALSDFLDKLKDESRIAMELLGTEAENSPHIYTDFPEQIKKVTAEDIMKLARECLDDQFTTVLIVPKD